jgi:hypothetical protein
VRSSDRAHARTILPTQIGEDGAFNAGINLRPAELLSPAQRADRLDGVLACHFLNVALIRGRLPRLPDAPFTFATLFSTQR